jgi:hypothetical protein
MTCVRAEGMPNPISETSFSNWAGDIRINPTSIVQPDSVDELVAIVKEAERRQLSVHAVGSGWSFNDNFSTRGFSAGSSGQPGFLVLTDSLNRILSNTMGASIVNGPPDLSEQDPVFNSLTGSARKNFLVHVEAGAKVHDLHDTLDRMSVITRNGQSMDRGLGFALKTLGGSGGQSIAGVVSTSTHGGDVALPPIPDMVRGIHLVGAGGAEFFIQKGGINAIVDINLLALNMPCVAERIVSDDKLFDAALVSVGRMGIIYSLVIEVVDQFILREIRFQSTWSAMSSNIMLGTPVAEGFKGSPTTVGAISDLWSANRFLEIVILPYPNSSGDHDCFVVTRNVQQPGTPLKPDPSKSDLISKACELQPLEKSAVILALIAAAVGTAATLDAAAEALAAVPIAGNIAAALAVAADAAADAISVALAPLLVPSITIGDYIAAVTNLMTQFPPLLDVAKDTVNALLAWQLTPHDVTDKSHSVMDTYDYHANCYKAKSLEVAFDASKSEYLNFVSSVFDKIAEFAKQQIIYGGYISLRYCSGSSALLAIEQAPRTVCIEMSTLSGLDSEMMVLKAFETLAASMGATVHWGQLNERTRPDIENLFGPKLVYWRQALAFFSKYGNSLTFSNDFTVQRGLEIIGEKPRRKSDLSYLVPLLMN